MYDQLKVLAAQLETLFDACLVFVAPRIRELLVQAPLGSQPQSEPGDLVWEQQALHHSPGTPKDDKVKLRV